MAFHIELRVNFVKTLQYFIHHIHEYLNNILNLNTTFIFNFINLI